MITPNDLDTCIDPQAMSALLQANLPGFATGRWQIEQLRVSKARRNTSQRRNPNPMTVCYELTVADRELGTRGQQTLYGKVFRSGQSEAFFNSIDAATLVAPDFGDPLAHLRELEMVLWALPNDPKLPQLSALLSLARADMVPPAAELPIAVMPTAVMPTAVVPTAVVPTAVARAIFPQSFETDPALRVEGELMRYEPEVRATLRYTLTRPDTGQSAVVYAKTFADDKSQRVFERFSYFWKMALDDDDAPLVAQPLAHDAATRTVWQAAAHGVSLPQAIAGGGDAALLMGKISRALAALHTAPLDTQRQRAAEYWVEQVHRRARKIERIVPALGQRAAALAGVIAGHVDRATPAQLSLIHGDFHPDQISVDRGRIVLFDFDEFALGDPMEDLAEFIVKHEALGNSAWVNTAWADTAWVDSAWADSASVDTAPTEPGGLPNIAIATRVPTNNPVNSLIDGYARRAPDRFDAFRLQWHLTIQHLLQASRAFVFQQPGWLAALELRLARAETSAAVLERSTR